jgi:hypothetical protein
MFLVQKSELRTMWAYGNQTRKTKVHVLHPSLNEKRPWTLAPSERKGSSWLNTQSLPSA